MKVINDHWQDVLRLVMSIKTGTVTASVILRKLAAYPRQNGLAHALRELGKLERTIFTLESKGLNRNPLISCTYRRWAGNTLI